MARIDDRVDALLADPLRRDQLREGAMRVVRVEVVQVGEAVAVGSDRGAGEEQDDEEAKTHGEISLGAS